MGKMRPEKGKKGKEKVFNLKRAVAFNTIYTRYAIWRG